MLPILLGVMSVCSGCPWLLMTSRSMRKQHEGNDVQAHQVPLDPCVAAYLVQCCNNMLWVDDFHGHILRALTPLSGQPPND